MNIEHVIKNDFANLDHNDSDELRKFFDKYSCFKTADLACVLSRSIRTIRNYKNRAGIRSITGPKVNFVQHNIPQVPDAFEDTPKWWKKHYPKFGIKRLARASKLSLPTVRKRIDNHLGYRINQRDATRSNHPCCNKKWLLEYYVKRRYSKAHCAILAGVSDDTMGNWLAIHKIHQRHVSHGPIVGKSISKQAL